MAGNIKGLMIEIGGDTSGLQKALSDVNKELNKSQRELKSVEKALKLDPKNTELLAQKQKLLSESIDQTKTKISALKEAKAQADAAMQRGEEVNQEQYRELQREISNAEAKLKDLTEQADEFAQQSSKINKVGESMKDLGDKTKALSLGAVAALGAFSAAFNELDKGYDIIIEKTGATGDALDGLQKSMENVYGSLPVEVEEVGTAIGDVNSRFDVTGKELEKLSTQFIQFAEINNTDVSGSIASVQKIMSAWNVETDKAPELLGLITRKSQETGVAVGTLTDAVLNNNAIFKELDLNLAESVSLVSELESNGVQSATALAALKKAAAAYTKEGKSLKDGLVETIDEIKNAATETEALAAAQKVFGAKGALEMSRAIKEGRFSIEGLTKSMSEYGSVVSTTFEATLDPIDHAKVLMNNLKIAGAQLGATLMNSLTPMLEKLVASAKKAVDSFSQMSESQKKLTLVLIGLTAVISPLLTGLGNLLTSLNTIRHAVTALWTLITAHPIGALITAIAALSVGLIVWANNAASAYDANDALIQKTAEFTAAAEAQKERIDSLNASMQNLNQTAQTRLQDAEAEAYTNRLLADELFNLSEQTTLTAAEKERMQQIVTQLNGSVEGLSLAFNSETGQLNLTRDAVQGLIDKQLELAQTRAAIELYTEQMKNFYAAEIEAEKAANGLKEAQDQYNTIAAQGKEVTVTHQGVTQTYTKYTNEQIKALKNCKDAIDSYKAQLDSSKASVDNAIKDTEAFSKVTGIDVPESFKKAATQAKTSLDNVKTELKSTTTSAKTEGGNFASGYAKGIEGGGEGAYRAGYKLGRRALQGTKDAQQSRSPAKETQKLGRYFVEGYALGIENFVSLATEAAESLAVQTVAVLQKSIEDSRTEVQKVLDSYNKQLLDSEKKYASETERITKEHEKAKEKIDAEQNADLKKTLQKTYEIQEKADKTYLEELKNTAEKERKTFDATEKDITNRQKNVSAALKTMISGLDKSITDLTNKRNQLATSLTDKKLFETKNIKVEGESYSLSNLVDFRPEVSALNNYNKLLDELFEKRDLPEEVRKALQGMSLSEGAQYVSALLNASDKEFEDYVKGLQLRAELSQGISTKLYGNELETLRGEIETAFEGLETDFELLGENSAELFGEGFLKKLRATLLIERGLISDSVNVNFTNPYAVKGGGNNISITQYIESSEHTAYDVAQSTKKTVENVIERTVLG